MYFSNDKGKHSRFLFLGMSALVREKLFNNDGSWFMKFTKCRREIERFLIDHKSLIGITLQNLPKGQRIPRMRDLFDFLTHSFSLGTQVPPEAIINHLGMSGRVYDITSETRSTSFSDETKSQIFYKEALSHAQICPICGGLLDTGKSVSYDHIQKKSDGGLGTAANGQMVHPYCNTAMKG